MSTEGTTIPQSSIILQLLNEEDVKTPEERLREKDREIGQLKAALQMQIHLSSFCWRPPPPPPPTVVLMGRPEYERKITELEEQVQLHKGYLAKEDERMRWYRERVTKLEQDVDELKADGGSTFHQRRIATFVMPACQICRYDFDNHLGRIPRLLDCGHTLCEDCAERIADGHTFIECPFDRTDTWLEVNGVSQLPKNFSVIEVIDSNKQRNEVVRNVLLKRCYS